MTLCMVAATLAVGAETPAGAQTPVHLWSTRFGGVGADVGRAVAVDGSGIIAVTGNFSQAVDFGGGDLFSAANSDDIFFAEYSSSGTHQWSKGFGASQNDYGYGVAVDGSGNAVFTGQFNGTVNFGGGPLTSAGGSDIFVAKYNLAGGHLWSKRFGSTADDVAYAVAMNGAGDVAITGHFAGTIDFGGGPLTLAGTNADIFVAKFDANGVHQWSRRLGDTQADEGMAIAMDESGNVVVTGNFQGTVDFGGGPLTSAGFQDIFVAKYDANGVHQWSRRFGGLGGEIGNAIALDRFGNVVVTGGFADVVDFGGGPLTSAGAYDIFLAKYNSSGVHQWSKRFGSTGFDEGYSVAMDRSGYVAVTGYFDNTVDFGGGPRPSAGNHDIFLAKYDASGVHQWSQRFGDQSYDFGHAVAMDTQGIVVFTGEFRWTADFGGGPLQTAFNTTDIFLAQYAPNVTGVGEAPGRYALSVSAYPNPFNPGTMVQYAVPGRGRVRVRVYDTRGREVATLVDEERSAGQYSVRWAGRDATGAPAKSGVYFLKLEQSGFVGTRRITLFH